METMVITLPNVLTLLRILAVPFFAIAVWYGHMPEACMLFVGAGLTDALDGYLARRFNQKSTLGAILDPAADKLLMLASFLALTFIAVTPPWLTALVLARDAAIIAAVLLAKYLGWPLRVQPQLLHAPGPGHRDE